MLGIIEVTLWGKSCTAAEKLEGKNAGGAGTKCSPAVVIEQSPAEQPASSRTVAPPATASAAKSPVTEEQKKLIMGMSDEELTKVINNPMLYANPAFVEEARSTLLKRQAWEMIKDYSDMQLLDIVHNNSQGFAYEVLDASSMELLARETEEFVNEIKSLSTEQLQGIVSNPDSYFDGYVRLATRTLNERLNNSEKE
ncbi:MAG: hypothetical protein K2L73_00655 [Muribaculaceae bacterium]|nr:hypothetical protein [Muribaculaceae bacterium]